MWQELVWNVDFLRGLIFFTFGILAAIFLIPWMLRHIQRERDKRLARNLLRQWGVDCIGAIMRLKPLLTPPIEIEGYSHTTSSGGWGADLPAFLFWKDIREGKKKPEGAANIMHQAISNLLFSDKERKMKTAPPNKTYPFSGGDPEVPRAMIKRVLNPMYAKLEIFDLELLPINELEMAMSALEAFSQRGAIPRDGFSSYALHLAQAMEKFASYLWKLENWSSDVAIESQINNRRGIASSHFSIAITLGSFALISKGLSQVFIGSTSALFFISGLLLLFNGKMTRPITDMLQSLKVGYMPIFLGLISLTIVSFTKNLVTLGLVSYIIAYCFLTLNISVNLFKAHKRKRATG